MSASFDRFSYLLPCLAAFGGLALFAKGIIHYFQLESYQFYGYFKTLRRQYRKIWDPLILYAVFCAVLLWLCRILPGTPWLAVPFRLAAGAAMLYAAAKLGRYARALHGPQKKKLVLTARVKRLCFFYGVLLVLTALLSRTWAFSISPWLGFLPPLTLLLLSPGILALAALVALPVEKGINALYVRDAKRRLDANPDLIRIGITGSYGKTSVKFILETLLSEKYRVLATPGSFNTPMGLTRIIRERLEPSHRVFIGEMGARHTGDIRELCHLVRPEIGILTSVGPQHLDTFKNLENIKNTKYDLIRALPKNGYAVFADDGGIVSGLYEKTLLPKALVGKKGDALWADEVRLSSRGSEFDLHAGDRVIHCETRLLGKYNITNILLAAACALHLGLSDEELARGISRLKPVEHRLCLMDKGDGITVIDDAFNANPSGSAAAMETLAAFPGRHIVVTPGMVELGADEDRFNYEFGLNMAKCADLVYLVGRKHTEPIARGLEEGGLKTEQIRVVESLAEANGALQSEMRPGDVILYENDLPDHYNEG